MLRQRKFRAGKTGQSTSDYQQLEPRQLLAVDVGLNFEGSALNVDSSSFAPNTMGAVGPDHIVELINERYTVYDKSGNELESSNLNDFWTMTAGATISGDSIQPRIVYDPISARFFATSIGAEADNQVYVAITMSNDPTAGWQSVQFSVDTLGEEQAVIATLGYDANGIYIATNNEGPSGDDLSVFSIPKRDLLGAVPSVARMTRFEGLDPTMFGSTIQVAQDIGVSSRAIALSAFDSGTTLIRSDIVGSSGPGAGLTGPIEITVPAYESAPAGRQPSGDPLLNLSPEFTSNIVRANDSLWAVQSTAGTGANSAIRWYQIDIATNDLVNWGTIEDTNVDYLYPSIAVNEFGAITIGFTATGPDLVPSSAAVTGYTTKGLLDTPVVEFGEVAILTPGVDSYFISFENPWGNYSATRVDPNDPFSFWTFQELVGAPNAWSTSITELGLIDINPTVSANDGHNTIIVRSSPANADWVEILMDGTVTDVFERGSLSTLTIDGLEGDDDVVIDLTFGQPLPLDGISILGGEGRDTLRVIGGGDGQQWAVTGDGAGNIDGTYHFQDFEELIGSENDDVFTINETGTDLLIRGGTGNDQFIVTGPVVGHLELRGETGNDYYRIPIEIITTVDVIDSIGSEHDVLNAFATEDADEITFLNDTIILNGVTTTGFVFAGIEALEIDGSGGDDVFNIQGTNMGTTVLGSEGNDLFNISSDAPFNQGNIEGLTHPFAVDGGIGQNQMVVSTYNTSAREVFVTDTSISGMGSVDISYAGLGGFSDLEGPAGITLIGSNSGADTFDILGLPASNSLRVEGAGGNDTTKVRAGVEGDVVIDGQNGADTSQVAMKNLSSRTVIIRDTGDDDLQDRLNVSMTDGSDLFEIIDNAIQVLAERIETDSNTENWVVNTLAGNDSVIVQKNETSQVRVLTGDGDDQIEVAATRGITGLRLDLGEGNDIAAVNRSVAASFVQVNGGRGDDTIGVGDEAYGSGRYDGQDGSDQVNVDLIGRVSRSINARDSGAAGDDSLFVMGTGLIDHIKLQTTKINNGVEQVFYNSNTEDLTIDTSYSGDVISVEGSDSPNTLILGQQGDDHVIVNATAHASIITIESGIGNDDFTVYSTAAGSHLTLLGQGGDDQFRIGSSPADNNGNLGRIRGFVSVVGGMQDFEDRLVVNDHGANSTYDYFVSSTLITNLIGPNSIPRDNFAGISHNSVEFLRLDGTDQPNYFSVRPSMTTRYYIDGNLPTPETVGNGRGDYLNILGDESDGRTLVKNSEGDGVWRFDNGLQEVRFESIENERIIVRSRPSNNTAPSNSPGGLQNRIVQNGSDDSSLAGSIALPDQSKSAPQTSEIYVNADDFFATEIDDLGLDWI